MITLLICRIDCSLPMVKPIPTSRAPGAPRMDLLEATRIASLPGWFPPPGSRLERPGRTASGVDRGC